MAISTRLRDQLQRLLDNITLPLKPQSDPHQVICNDLLPLRRFPFSYAQRTPSAPSYRPAAYPGSTYPHQFRTPGPAAPQYTQTNGQQQPYHHNTPAPSYTRPPAQPYQNIPQATPQAVRYPSQPPYAAQQQPIQNGAAYPQAYRNGAHVGRQSSPQKPVYNQSNHHSQPQGRPSYSTPTPPILPPNATRHMQGQLAQPPVINGSSQSPQPPPQPQQALPPQQHHQNSYNNMSTFLTSGEQQTIIDRQRAQISQQQGAQNQTRNAAPTGPMGSPQPQINANSAVAAGWLVQILGGEDQVKHFSSLCFMRTSTLIFMDGWRLLTRFNQGRA
ncbi:hypothetical protein EYC84_008981 [Monilinia fructicola]|uniref:Uncharacterized protein n=1 Tax=Monilinia fructicola TaxID=38448 RepID=A0A5M9JH34_MONFR|nr:hypothetical protein EYC84_008981 [Monilinia fructicola]